jgi:thymidine kinase
MLTVITGGMFAEKTTELLRQGRRLERAGKKVIYIKPDMDIRYSEDEIVTHNGESVPAVNISSNAPIRVSSKEYFDNDVFLIDEVQFFSIDILTAMDTLLLNGKTVIVAGLDLDATAHPFYITATLAAMAENVVKLHAVCADCGNDAWVSYKENHTTRIQLGTDEYKPLCRSCFYKTKNIQMGAK